jgi:hypothetical protein
MTEDDVQSLKKEVGSGVGSGSIRQRYGSGDPDPHQNVTDPQHWYQQRLERIGGLSKHSCLLPHL